MKIDVTHVAKLANLPLSDSEKEVFEKQLKETLDFVEILQEVDTENVKPTFQVTGLENIVREDKTSPSLSQQEAIMNSRPLASSLTSEVGQAKQTEKGFFKVKAVLEQ